MTEALISYLSGRAEHLRLFARLRADCQGWLKCEALCCLEGLAAMGSVRQFHQDRQRCDLWFEDAQGPVWMEVATVPTGYGSPGDKNLTPLMEEVTRRAEKVRGTALLAGGRPAMILLVYPYAAEEREKQEWRAYLLRLEAKGLDRQTSHAIPLGQGREARVFLLTG